MGSEMVTHSHPRIYDYRFARAYYRPVEARSRKFYDPLTSGRILVLGFDGFEREIFGILHGRLVRLWLSRNEMANWRNGDAGE